MEDQQTCGKGLAEHAALPGKLADLTESVAGILEIHTEAPTRSSKRTASWRANIGRPRPSCGKPRDGWRVTGICRWAGTTPV